MTICDTSAWWMVRQFTKGLGWLCDPCSKKRTANFNVSPCILSIHWM